LLDFIVLFIVNKKVKIERVITVKTGPMLKLVKIKNLNKIFFIVSTFMPNLKKSERYI